MNLLEYIVLIVIKKMFFTILFLNLIIIEINGCNEQDTPKVIQYIFYKQTKRYINQDDYELYNHAVRLIIPN